MSEKHVVQTSDIHISTTITREKEKSYHDRGTVEDEPQDLDGCD